MTARDGERQRVSSEEHREDVVRRLLASGLSPELLHALLPEFAGLIDELTGPARPAPGPVAPSPRTP